MGARMLSVGGPRGLGTRCGAIAAAVVLLGVAYPTAASAATPTTTALSPSPPNPVTNQMVTLTATVTASSGTVAPTGTVKFVDNNGTITGCDSVPLSAGSGTSATATCQTSYARSQSPRVLGAAYTPADSTFQASTAPAPTLTIGQDSSSTALALSTTSVGVGQSVFFTAAVTPAHSGATTPSGTLAFLDGGTPIAGCADQFVAGGGATCTTSYSAPGSHTITATYSGDINFGASTTPPQTVTVGAVPPPPANCSTAYNEGFNTGFNSGFNRGFASGFQSGFRRGFTRGFNSGFAHIRRLAAVVSTPSAREAQTIPPECSQTYNQGFNTGFNPGFNSGFNPGYKPGFQAGFKSGFNAGRRARH
jgi:plastocyanin